MDWPLAGPYHSLIVRERRMIHIYPKRWMIDCNPLIAWNIHRIGNGIQSLLSYIFLGNEARNPRNTLISLCITTLALFLAFSLYSIDMKSFSSIGFVLPLSSRPSFQFPVSNFQFAVSNFLISNSQLPVFPCRFPLESGATASSSVLVMAGFFKEKKILRSPWRPLDDLSFRAKPPTPYGAGRSEKSAFGCGQQAGLYIFSIIT
jgi:hypothetical protein